MATGGCDTLPDNGAVITLLVVCGLTRRQSNPDPDIGMINLIKTMALFGPILLYHATGLSGSGQSPAEISDGAAVPGDGNATVSGNG